MIYTFGPGVEIPFKTTIDWLSLTTCLWFSKYSTQFADGCSEAQHCYMVTSPTNELVAEHEPNADCYILIITEQCFGESISSLWLLTTQQEFLWFYVSWLPKLTTHHGTAAFISSWCHISSSWDPWFSLTIDNTPRVQYWAWYFLT